MAIPKDYAERVYSGVLGKIIGVYLGRPFEGWSHEDIIERLGEIDYYVNGKVEEYARRNHRASQSFPLIVTDDDITGTFTFLRAFRDNGCSRGISAKMIGAAWLNYIIENKTVFWWGGMGNSTEHTAFLRLKQGIPAPESGSVKSNGKIVSEQIGSQIFIDGWAMLTPGDPELAAEFALKAASVSHDGEAIFGAQVIAAIEAAAFVEHDMNRLLDTGVSFIPRDSLIYSVVSDVRDWHGGTNDWRGSLARIKQKYGYDKFGGNVHIVPNHALVILGLLYGQDDFQTAMRVVNTSGWDTDCNSGNVGCVLGIRGGLSVFDSGPDWRTPVADRILMPTAEGGGAISDAVIESDKIIHMGLALAGEKYREPKRKARFHFEFPGSIQGFAPGEKTTDIKNILGRSAFGTRSLAVAYTEAGSLSTPTFILPDQIAMPGYQLHASPSLYSGQTIKAALQTDEPLEARIFIDVYTVSGDLGRIYGQANPIKARETATISMTVPDTGGQPVAAVGVDVRSLGQNTLYLDFLTWDGSPDAEFCRPEGEEPNGASGGSIWRRAWVQGVDLWEAHWKQAYRLSQNTGIGLLIQGTRDWRDYEAETVIQVSMAESAGIAVRVQGMRRYYAFVLSRGGYLRLMKAQDEQSVLEERAYSWEAEKPYRMRVRVNAGRIICFLDDTVVFDRIDCGNPLTEGAVAFLVEEGHLMSESLSVRP